MHMDCSRSGVALGSGGQEVWLSSCLAAGLPSQWEPDFYSTENSEEIEKGKFSYLYQPLTQIAARIAKQELNHQEGFLGGVPPNTETAAVNPRVGIAR